MNIPLEKLFSVQEKDGQYLLCCRDEKSLVSCGDLQEIIEKIQEGMRGLQKRYETNKRLNLKNFGMVKLAEQGLTITFDFHGKPIKVTPESNPKSLVAAHKSYLRERNTKGVTPLTSITR